MSDALLELIGVTVRFGGLVAVSNLDFAIRARELVGLIGPNGAGKTTVFNVMTGVCSPSEGQVLLKGRSLVGLPSHRIAAAGISRTFQNIRLFSSLSVLDNVLTAFNVRLGYGILGALWNGRKVYEEDKRLQQECLELLDIFGLQASAELPCRSLSYGDQRRLEIVRALATKPQVLLLDEPAAGMNATEKLELMRLIRFVQERFGLSVLLVEHDMKVVMGICQRVGVIEYGRKIAEGTPEEIKRNPKVIAAYLGEEVETDA